MKTLREFLLAAGLITDTSDLRFNLQDLIVLLLDQLLDSLESLISLLHTKEGLLPILEEGLLAHNNLLDFDGGFLEGVAGSSGLFLLRNKLGLIEGLLLVQALDLLVHGINKKILLLLRFFEVNDVFFSAICCAAGYSNLTLHDLVVLFDLLECAVELIELLLSLQDTLQLLISLFLPSLVLLLQDLQLFLSVNTVFLHNIVVVVGALESGLHLCELVLHSVELDTDLLTLLLDLADLFLLLAELQIDALMLIGQLLCQGILKALHKRL